MNTQVHLDQESGRSSIDLDKVLAQPSASKMLYICDLQYFMAWLRDEARARGWDGKNISIERFSVAIVEDQKNRDSTVALARSDKAITVKTDDKKMCLCVSCSVDGGFFELYPQ